MNHFYIEKFYNMCCLNLTRQEILDYLNTCNYLLLDIKLMNIKNKFNKKIEIKLMNIMLNRLKTM